ncbi:MAG TPA: tetratricopeptide repeat protein [Myxococcaceae bacterium]|nr:tetratricopeptide repeat protein [Myxococcaceae bacterium]
MTIALNDETAHRVRAFARGEMTWAEVERMTWAQARAAMHVGCDMAAADRLDDAKTVFEGLVALNPKDAASQAALGTVYQKLGRPADAEAAYSAALRIDPKNAVALSNRGEFRLKRGDKEGVVDLGLAVEADPLGETAAGRRAGALLRALALRIAAARVERA